MNRRWSDPGDRVGGQKPGLKLGDLQHGVDAVLHCPDLGGDFISGIFNQCLRMTAPSPVLPRTGVAIRTDLDTGWSLALEKP